MNDKDKSFMGSVGVTCALFMVQGTYGSGVAMLISTMVLLVIGFQLLRGKAHARK